MEAEEPIMEVEEEQQPEKSGSEKEQSQSRPNRLAVDSGKTARKESQLGLLALRV